MKIYDKEEYLIRNESLPELAYIAYLRTLNKLVAVVLIVLIVGHTEVPTRTWQVIASLIKIF